jgi:predicted outer membrane repeat protein
MMKCCVLLWAVVFVTCCTVSARTWYISPDGTGDAPTIQAGIDSASIGDTVLVGCGTYYQYNIHMKSGVILLSEHGEADCVTIDAQYLHRVFWCGYCDSVTVIKGFTIARGMPYLGNPGTGGGMFIGDSPGLVIKDCVFLDNVTHYAAGVWCQGCSPEFTNCIFAGNYGISEGGALTCAYSSSPTLENCVFAGNRAGWSAGVFCGVLSAPVFVSCTFYGNRAYHYGGAFYCMEMSTPILERTVIAYCPEGEAIWCQDEWSVPTLTCCDIYGNAGGDWTGLIADQLGTNGNFSADPRFCDAPGGNLTLEDCSPCLPGYHPDGYDCGGVIGAYGSGCACGAPTIPSTWGMIKAMYK